MQSNDVDFYSLIIQWLKDPAVLSTIGGAFAAVGALINKGVMAIVKKIGKYIKSIFIRKGPICHPIDEEYSRGGLELNRILEKLRLKLDCARVSIIQFHNGHKFSLSNPVFKLSATFEALSSGFVPTYNHVRELMVAPFINIVAPLILSNNPVNVPGVYEIDKCKKDSDFGSCQKSLLPLRILKINRDELAFCSFRTLMETLGVEAAYAVLLTSPDGGPIGLLLMQFYKREGSKEKVQTATCDICSTKHTIQNLLYVPA